MGLYKQPNHWSCGPFALKHALVALGQIADEREIARIARTHWWSGTDEVRLARAARAYDCDLPLVRRVEPERARRTLVDYLAKQIPVLVCVDNWEHWITVVAHEQGRFVVIDSRTDPVLGVADWPRLRARWRYLDEDSGQTPAPTLYDLHPVKPRFRVEMPAKFSVKRAQFLRRPENLDLARYWEEYLSDLLEICRPRSPRSAGLSMGEFLRRHQELLVERVRHWHGYVEREAVQRILRNYRFVAETYGLVIPAASARRALADLAVLLTLWSAASRGVNPIYGSDSQGQRRRRR